MERAERKMTDRMVDRRSWKAIITFRGHFSDAYRAKSIALCARKLSAIGKILRFGFGGAHFNVNFVWLVVVD